MFARFWAKRRYIVRQEMEAALNDLNAAVSAQRAQEKRDLIPQLSKEADAIDKNIAEIAAMEEKGFWRCENGHEKPKCTLALCDEHEASMCEECKTVAAGDLPTCEQCDKATKLIKRSEMTGQEKYESDQERKEAEKVAESKRQYAAQLVDEVKGQEDTAKHFRRQAASSRELADRLKQI